MVPEKSLKDIELERNWKERKNGKTWGMIIRKRMIVSYKMKLDLHNICTILGILPAVVPEKSLALI